MAATLVTVIVIFLVPAVSTAGARRFAVIDWISPVIICYLSGMALANLAPGLVDGALAQTATEAAVALAIPLLLFSTDVPRWLRLAGKTVLSFALACVSVLIVSAGAAVLFADRVPDAWKVAGMVVGVYTGGTPNMTAIGLALGVPSETFVLVNGADVLVCAFYILFLMSVAQRVLHLFLPRFVPSENAPADLDEKRPVRPRDRAVALGMALGAAGVAAGLSWVFTGGLSTVFVILAITSLGVAASFVPRVRALRGSYETGEFVLLVFCVAIGTLADFKTIVGQGGAYLEYVAVVVWVSALLHYALAAAFRIDADTVLITSTAAIFGPAFVGPVAKSLKNREIVMSGVTTGLVGYAVGNYLGLGLAYLLKP